MAERRRAPKKAQRLLWERQEGESAQAFQAFAEYRGMGAGRSLAKVSQKLGKSKTLMERWSRQWGWVKRVDAWDGEMDRLSRKELEKGITEMRKKHVAIAESMLDKSMQALGRMPVEAMAPRDVSTMVEVASKIERISRGEATERTEGKQTVTGEVRTESVCRLQSVDLSGLTDGELERLHEIIGKLDVE